MPFDSIAFDSIAFDSLAFDSLFRRHFKISSITRLTRRIRIRTFCVAVTCSFLTAAFFGITNPNAKVITQQAHLQRQIGVKAANRFLYANEKELQNASAIISYYKIMEYLPGFSEKYIRCLSHTIGCIRKKAREVDGDVYVFYHKGLAGNATQTYRNWIDTGRARIVDETDKYMLIQLIK